MTVREAGFLLLTSSLGDPGRKVLTDAQLRTLSKRVINLQIDDPGREIDIKDLCTIGYSEVESERILELLSHQDRLEWYLSYAKRCDCYPITRVSEGYPEALRQKLGPDAPGCLWAKGNQKILEMPMIALVGSREPDEKNRDFAREVGRQAALQGYALVSGNARGSDREAQNACLKNGGFVVSVLADGMTDKNPGEHMLLLSEGGFDLPFTPQRALHRNTVIHCLAEKVFVSQCRLERGGTWNGCVRNLRHDFSQLCCYADGSAACQELVARGAVAVGMEDLSNISQIAINPTLF